MAGAEIRRPFSILFRFINFKWTRLLPTIKRIPIAEAKRLYLDEKWKISRIAAHLGVSAYGIRLAFEREGVEKRNDVPTPVLITREQIEELYFVQNLSFEETAKKLGRGYEVLRANMRRLGIDRKPPPPWPHHYFADHRRLDDLAIGEGFIIKTRSAILPTFLYTRSKKLGIRIVI